MIVIGIDPGISGAVVALNNEDWSIVAAARMPTCPDNGKNIVDSWALTQLLKAWATAGSTCNIERVHSMPTDGGAQAFAFGMAYGTALGSLSALAIPVTKVTPQKWKKNAGVKQGAGAVEGPGENPTEEEKKAYRARIAKAKRVAKDFARGRAIELWPAWEKLRTIEAGQAFADAALIARFGAVA